MLIGARGGSQIPPPRGDPPRAPRHALDYDVVLDVPSLCLDDLRLQVDSLKARVSLDAKVANVVYVRAGARVALGRADLSLVGVRTTVLLAVDLSFVRQIVAETMSYLDVRPDLLARTFADTIRHATSAAPLP